MQETLNLNLPYIVPSQAQKHVTHNEALRILDAVVQVGVLDRDLTSPPLSPAEGDRYLVAAGATGLWQGRQGQIAAWQDDAWMYYAPRIGWLAWIADEQVLLAHDGATWLAARSVNPMPLAGVNTIADAINRLSVASPASLFTHEGAGHQLKINKNAAGDKATIVFQTDFSGRAEMGLAGDNDYHFKVSPDGSAWHEAITIDRETGEVSLPSTLFPGFETSYIADSLVMPHGNHTLVSNATLGLDELGDSSYLSGVWTVGERDAGLWLVAAFAQFNASIRGMLTLEVSRDGGAWDIVSRVQDEGAGEISRTMSTTPMLFLSTGDKFRFTSLHANTTSAANTLRFFTANGRRIQ